MKRLPCFLMLAGFLATFVGCQTSLPIATPKMVAAPPATAPPIKEEPVAKEEPPVGSLYSDEVRNGPLARLLQQGPVPVVFICVATGEFNIAPASDKLLMETWCVEQDPIPGLGLAMMQVEDTVAPRTPGKRVFNVLFKDAVVSVAMIGGQQEVRLHYKDPSGQFQDVLLSPRSGEKYRYSFAKIPTKELEPIGTNRTIELRR